MCNKLFYIAVLVFWFSLLTAQENIVNFQSAAKPITLINSVTINNQNSVLLLANSYDELSGRPGIGDNIIIETDLEGFELNRTMLMPELTDNLYDSELLMTEDSVLFVVGVNQASINKLWIGILDDDFNIVQEVLYPLGDSIQELFIQNLYYRTDKDRLFVVGNGTIQGQAPTFRWVSACVEIEDSIRLINSHNTDIGGTPSHAIYIDGEYMLPGPEVSGFTDSINTNWEIRDFPSLNGMSAGASRINETTGDFFFSGKPSGGFPNNFGGMVQMYNSDFELIAHDTMVSTFDYQSLFKIGRNSLLINNENLSVYAIGTKNEDPLSGPFPFLRQNTTITNIRYDLDLNRIFTRTYGGDAFYNIHNSTLLPNGNIASVGYRYYDETDLLEGILLITNGEHGATTATTFPGRRVAALPLSIVPNPVTDRFVVETQDGDTRTYQLIVRDMAGRKVLERKGVRTGETVVSGNWPAGIYTVVLSDSGRVIRSGKLVKQ